MTTKLDWNYDDKLGCEVAYHNGYRIRAERDDSPQNPFEDWDGNWPIMVRYDGDIKVYEKTGGPGIRSVLSRFNDEQIIFSQRHIEGILGCERVDLHMHGVEWDDDETPPKWVTDADALRSWFDDAFSTLSDSELLDTLAELYRILDIHTYRTTSRGHCQGDWAEVLVVATPEAIKEFGTDVAAITAEVRADPYTASVDPAKLDDWVWSRVCDKLLESTADLYGDWAWGNVYGYVIEQNVNAEAPAACNMCDNTLNDGSDICDQCGGDFEDPEPDWEEIEHGSCWGYYGDDHEKSGLEEAALECVPDEPVRLPDALLEDA